jgi:hypothetical protein
MRMRDLHQAFVGGSGSKQSIRLLQPLLWFLWARITDLHEAILRTSKRTLLESNCETVHSRDKANFKNSQQRAKKHCRLARPSIPGYELNLGKTDSSSTNFQLIVHCTMRFITGDECGVIKEFVSPGRAKNGGSDGSTGNFEPVKRPTIVDGIRRVNGTDPMTRSNSVIAMSWMGNSGNEDWDVGTSNDTNIHLFAALHIRGGVQIWQGQFGSAEKHGSYTREASLGSIFAADNETALGLAYMPGQSRHPGALVACSRKGTIVVWNPQSLADDDNEGSVDPLSNASTFPTVNAQSDQEVNMTTFCSHATEGWVAVGGKDRDMLLFDLRTAHSNGTKSSPPSPLWKAKNVAPDPQTLLAPQVWPTASCFWSSPAASFSNLLVVGSAYRQVRIYDLRMHGSRAAGEVPLSKSSSPPPLAPRRPLWYTSLDEAQRIVDHRITALCPLNDHVLAVGDAGGDVVAMDIRTLSGGAVLRDCKNPIVRRFVGPAGSVRQLQTRGSRLASVSLDRMLRVHDASSTSTARARQPLQTVYLKQRLNCALVSGEPDVGNDDNDDQEDGEIDQEDNVQDYVDSDNESFQDEDDVLEEMIDALEEDNEEEDEDEEDDDEEENDGDEDEGVEESDIESEDDARPRTKRRRQ